MTDQHLVKWNIFNIHLEFTNGYGPSQRTILRIILDLQECDQQLLNTKALSALKWRLSPIYMECFHFYYPIVAHISHWNMIYILEPSNLQPSSLALAFVCSVFFVNHRLELQPFWPAIKLTSSLKHKLLYNECHWRKKWMWILPDWFFSALGCCG